MPLAPGVEFCICTFNRSVYLQRCVQPLLKQLVPERTLLTIVDNGSTDDTAVWVKELERTNPLVRYLYEPVQGLSQARNTGYGQALYDWVFYLDDDCIPSDSLVAEAIRLVDAHPAWSVIGGPILPVPDEVDVPGVMKGFGVFSLPFKEVTELQRDFIRGGCMLVRISALKSVGGFNTRYGMKGKMLQYGEELELQLRLRKIGLRIAYVPQLWVYHHIRPEKITIGWILASEYARRRDKRRFDPLHPAMALLLFMKTLVGRIIWLPVYGWRWISRKNYGIRDFLIELFKPIAFRFGDLMGSRRSEK